MTDADTVASVEVRDEDQVRTITLNRPQKKNAVTRAMVGRMADAVAELAGDTSTSVIVIEAVGEIFSAGHDVGELMSKFTDREDYVNLPATAGRLAKVFRECPQVVVADVRGGAIGEGADIALMCDLVVATTDAYFSDLHLLRGVVPGAGSWNLPQLVGAKRAAEFLLLCEKIPADRALDWGLVNRVVLPGEADAEVQRIVDRLLQMPPVSLRLAKRAMQVGVTADLAETMQHVAYARSIASKTTEAHASGASFYASKSS